MHDVLLEVLDDRALFRVMPDYAPNIITGLGRLGGACVVCVCVRTRGHSVCVGVIERGTQGWESTERQKMRDS
jgi:acetyl-CoA carboxylase carboxyltransferase component